MTYDEKVDAQDRDGERRMERMMEDEYEARFVAAPPSAAPAGDGEPNSTEDTC
jgi:hypothetical protein